MPDLRAALTRAIVGWMVLSARVVRRLKLAGLAPTRVSDPELTMTLGEHGVKPEELASASILWLLILSLAVGPGLAALLLSGGRPGLAALAWALCSALGLYLARLPYVHLALGAERFGARVDGELAGRLGAVERALRRGDEFALVEALRGGGPALRRVVAEAQLRAASAGGGVLEALVGEARSWPDEDVRALASLMAALRDPSARAAASRALARASLDALAVELAGPLSRSLSSARAAADWMVRASGLALLLVPAASLAGQAGLTATLSVAGLRADLWTLSLLAVSLAASGRILSLASRVDVDPATRLHPSARELAPAALLAAALASAAALALSEPLGPAAALVPPLAALLTLAAGRIVASAPVRLGALEELASVIREYASLRRGGLNRLAAFRRVRAAVGHPEPAATPSVLLPLLLSAPRSSGTSWPWPRAP